MPDFDLKGFRNQGFTDRDAPTLYGLTPERKLGELFDTKVELTELDEPRFGDLFTTPAKEIARERLFGKKPLKLSALVCRHAAMPFFLAEIDGACFEDSVLVRVVQLPRSLFHCAESESLPVSTEDDRGRIPRRHWVEIQHQMIASGIRKGYFVATMDGTQVALVPVLPDDVFRSNHVAEVIQFMDYVRRGVRPPGAEAKRELCESCGAIEDKPGDFLFAAEYGVLVCPRCAAEPKNPEPELPGINSPNEEGSAL